MPPKTKGEVVKKELLKEFAIADIVPFDRNPRKNELAVNAVMKSIVANNYIAPIIIDEKNVIIVGHTRLKALIELGKDKCDVIQVSGLTDKQKKDYRILDNKTGEIAEWDHDILNADFTPDELKEFDLFINMGNLESVNKVNDGSNNEWVGMPEFTPAENSLKIIIHFESESDREDFLKKYPMEFLKKESKAWSTWYPFREREDLSSLKYE